MKKYYYIILLILFFGLLSCSNEETKTQNQVAARPTVPIQNGEVQIGTQVWTTKNLNVSRFRNGDLIPHVPDASQWAYINYPAWTYYNNISTNGTVYGKLYNWYAVNDSRGLAPEGFHVPSDTEWTTLINFLGGASIAGGKMKETGTNHWQSPNTGATNEVGFKGLPGGCVFYYDSPGSYQDVQVVGGWWSSTEAVDSVDPFSIAVCYQLNRSSQNSNRYSHYKRYGYSVRCIKN